MLMAAVVSDLTFMSNHGGLNISIASVKPRHPLILPVGAKACMIPTKTNSVIMEQVQSQPTPAPATTNSGSVFHVI